MANRLTKKQWIILGGLIMLFVVIPFTLYFIFRPPADTETISIQNYDEIIRNLPEERKYFVLFALRTIVALNNPSLSDAQIPSIQDSRIRNESLRENIPAEGRLEGTFIVDIDSLQQSYRITYQYSSLRDGYAINRAIVASCLADNELLYAPFDCKNPLAGLGDTAPQTEDPLLSRLPYSTPFYTITGSDVSGEKRIVVRIMLNTNNLRALQAFGSYRTEVRAWLLSLVDTLDPYTIEWRNLSNQVIPERTQLNASPGEPLDPN
jgi:hypothetical protein